MSGNNGHKTMVEYALEALEVGAVFPCNGKIPAIPSKKGGHGCLDATRIQIRVRDFWADYPDANPAISTDDLITLDFDTKENAFPANKEAWQTKYGLLPRTKVHRTGGGGEHWIYRAPAGLKISGGDNCYGILHVDMRAWHQYIMAPGSIHPVTGRRYEVIDDSPITDAPDYLVEVLKSGTKSKTAAPIGNTPLDNRIPRGQQDDWLISQAGVYRRRGDSEEIIFEKLKIDAGRLNQNPNRRPYDDDDFRRIAHSAGRYEPDAPPRQTGYIVTDKNGNQTLDQDAIVTDLLAEFHFKTYEDTNQVLVYRNGVYRAGGEQFVRAECQRRVGVRALLSEHRVNEIVGHIRRSTFSKRAEFNRPGEIINLQNGLLNVRTRLLSSHTPEFLSTVQLPIAYHPDAKGTRVGRFFSETLNSSDVPLIAELFGFCLLSEYRIQKAFLLVSEGSNGKSTLLKLLMAFVGECNCSHVSWQQLELNRFAMADLEGKLVNSFADLPSQGMSMTTAFKMLTGGDSISAERKFMPSFSFVNFAKLIFSTNKPPKVDGEDSFAFWRRWIIVEFPNSFKVAPMTRT